MPTTRPIHRCLLLCAAAALALAGEGAADGEKTFVSKLDGTVQRYIEILPPGKLPRRPDVLIALHGHGSDRTQFARDGRAECRAARDAAGEASMVFVSPDYRAPTSWMGPAAEADLMQLIRIYRDRGAGRIIIAGASMGGTSALIFAALHPEQVQGVCAMNPMADMTGFAGFADAIAASYGGTKQQKPEEYRKRSPVLAPKQFLAHQVAITTGGRDATVPPESALELARLLKEQRADGVLLIHRPEGGHSTGYDDAKAALAFAIRAITPR